MNHLITLLPVLLWIRNVSMSLLVLLLVLVSPDYYADALLEARCNAMGVGFTSGDRLWQRGKTDISDRADLRVIFPF